MIGCTWRGGKSGRGWRLSLAAFLIGMGMVPEAFADGSGEAIQAACAMASEQAQAHQQDGKLREARGEFEKCSEAICPVSIHEDCARRLVAVDDAMPTIVLAARDSTGSDIRDVRVSVDGQLFADRVDGMPRPIDPGPHHFAFQASGLPVFETTWVIMEGEKNRRERVVFPSTEAAVHAAPPPSAHPRSSTPSLATHPVARGPRALARAEPFWQSTWFWGAVGAAALIGGAVYFSSNHDTAVNTIHLQMQVPH